MVTNAPSGPLIKSEEVMGGNADEALGVGSVVIAVHPITEVGLGGMSVGVGRGVGFRVCPGEQELRISRTKSENIRSTNVFTYTGSLIQRTGFYCPTAFLS